MAWKLGCKGCTVYRDGSRQVQVLNLNKNVKDKSEVPLTAQLDGDGSLAETAATIEQTVEAATLPNPVVAQSAPTPAITDASGYGIITPRERPQILEGKTYQVKTAYGNLYITVNDTPGDGPFEVFSQLGKAGGFFHSQVEAICRLISLNLRAGVKVEEVINQLKGIRGPDPMWNQGKPMLSIADAIAQTLERHLEGKSKQTKLEFPTKTEAIEATQSPTMQKVEIEEVILTPGPGADLHPTKPATSIANIGTAPACPDCGNMLNMAEGCMTCNNCGFSKCG